MVDSNTMPARENPSAMIAPVSPLAAASASVGGGGGTYKRRKFVAKAGMGGHGTRKAVNLETVQQALEEDSSAVEVLRRDVMSFQATELDTSRKYLQALRKTYDKLRSSTDSKENQQRHLQEELAHLDRLVLDSKSGTGGNAELERLQLDFEEREKEVRDALVQKDVFSHMEKRLTDDVMEVKRSSVSAQEQLVTTAGETAHCTLLLQTAKQELKTEELKLSHLNAKVKSRRQLQSERVAGIQRIIKERSELLEKQEERMRMREVVMARSNFDLGMHEEQKLRRMHVVRKVYSSMLEKKISVEEEDLSALEATFQQIKIVTGLSDVDEIVQKFLMRQEKSVQLEKVVEDVRARIDALREENSKQRLDLEQKRADYEATAGNRDTYDKIESYNNSLGDSMREADEAKDRAIQAKVTLEELKLAVARFRTRLENKPVATPSDTELPSYLRDLDIQLSYRMKVLMDQIGNDADARASVSSPMRSSPGAGDGEAAKAAGGGGGGGGGSDSTSAMPFAKLQSDKLKKMLYNKMMLAQPDSSTRNVRISPRLNHAQLDRMHRRKLVEQYYEDQEGDVGAFDADVGAGPSSPSGDAAQDDNPLNTVIDRTMVKKLASMITAENAAKKRTRRRRPGDEDLL